MKRVLATILILAMVLSLGCTAFADAWTCPDCNTENSGKFCGNCGRDRNKPLDVQRESIMDLSRSETWFCQTCVSYEKTNFCTNCGEKRNEDLVGTVVTFGAYEQDNEPLNGVEPIEWLVLADEGDRILVISRYALDTKPYNDERVDVTWETCTLRTWLNGEFLNSAFTQEEQQYIQKTTVTADKNLEYDTDPGNDTQDMVFLLSIKEATEYFESNEARMCRPTAYAIEKGAYTNEAYSVGGAVTCRWWLRSPGGGSIGAAYVSDDGSVSNIGYYVNFSRYSVRPALWITV